MESVEDAKKGSYMNTNPLNIRNQSPLADKLILSSIITIVNIQ
jgi:hypothetical protein